MLQLRALFGWEGIGFERAVALLDERLHLAFGGVKFLLANGGTPCSKSLRDSSSGRSPFSSWSTMVSSCFSDSSKVAMPAAPR
jgi:hypothetical protein